MALKIGASEASSAIQRARERIEKSLAQLSSGARITRAADDAAGLALSEQLNATERALAQGQRNLSDGVSLTRTAEGALGEISEIVTRMRELAVQAGNGALAEGARDAVRREFEALGSEATRIANATEFGGRKLLNGELQGAGAVLLRDGTGSSGAVQVALEDSSAEGLGLAGLDPADPASLDALDAALRSVSSQRGDLGAIETRLESGLRNLESARENTAASLSRISDADVARSASELTRAQILEQAAVATRAQANVSAATALALLR
ncbi:MAG: flagellin [Myxococcota bacterium]